MEGSLQHKPNAAAAIDDLAALERFVVENDELLALEERIGRFNIFDALGVARAEIRHSNFLAWLLDPGESHGQGDLFLKAILMDLARKARDLGLRPPFSPVHLDGADLSEVEIRREWRNIDLLIVCHEPKFVIAIENKVDSGEHSGQLQRYEDVVKAEFAEMAALHVFLTPDGREASDEDWAAYSYADIHRVLTRVGRTNATSIGSDVAAFLEHYLRLIEGRMMDDPQIDELCRRIYRNHRAAIDLIVERLPKPGTTEIVALRDWLEKQPAQWIIRNSTRSMVFFVPASWVGSLCNERGEPLPTAICDVYLECEIWEARHCNLSARLVVGIGQDSERRMRAIAALNDAPFGLGMQRKSATSKWTRLGSRTLMKWDSEQAPETLAVESALDSYLDELRPKLALMPATLAGIK